MYTNLDPLNSRCFNVSRFGCSRSRSITTYLAVFTAQLAGQLDVLPCISCFYSSWHGPAVEEKNKIVSATHNILRLDCT